MWRKRNPLALLVGMQSGAATVDNSMENPQKLKIKIPYDPEITLLDIYPKNTRTLIQKDLCAPMFNAALFITAKIWNNSCSSVDKWIKMM